MSIPSFGEISIDDFECQTAFSFAETHFLTFYLFYFEWKKERQMKKNEKREKANEKKSSAKCMQHFYLNISGWEDVGGRERSQIERNEWKR